MSSKKPSKSSSSSVPPAVDMQFGGGRQAAPVAHPVDHANIRDPSANVPLAGIGTRPPTFTLKERVQMIVTPFVVMGIVLPLLYAFNLFRYLFLGGKAEAETCASRHAEDQKKALDHLNSSLKSSSNAFTDDYVTAPLHPQGGDIRLHIIHNTNKVTPTAEKPLVLFLHGYPQIWASWLPQMVVAANKNYPVAALELRGYGLSDAPQGVKYYAQDILLEDVQAAVKKFANGHPIILASHDWGAAVAWLWGCKYGSSYLHKGFFVSAPHPGFMLKYAIRYDWLQLFKSWYMFFFQLPFLPEMMQSLNPPSYARYTARFSEVHPAELNLIASNVARWNHSSAMISYYRAIFRYPAKTKFLPIDAPSTLVWGSHDEALSPGLATMLPRYLLPNGRVEVLEGSHFLQSEKTAEVNAALEKLLDL